MVTTTLVPANHNPNPSREPLPVGYELVVLDMEGERVVYAQIVLTIVGSDAGDAAAFMNEQFPELWQTGHCMLEPIYWADVQRERFKEELEQLWGCSLKPVAFIPHAEVSQ